jgi:hypothetical protein
VTNRVFVGMNRCRWGYFRPSGKCPVAGVSLLFVYKGGVWQTGRRFYVTRGG